MVITDELLKKMSHPEATVIVLGKKYHITKDQRLAVGDTVLDRKDGCHGVIDTIRGDKSAVRCGGVIEVCVPLTRLVKLTPCNEGNVKQGL